MFFNKQYEKREKKKKKEKENDRQRNEREKPVYVKGAMFMNILSTDRESNK